MTLQIGGVCAAVLTPLDAGLRPDAPKAVAYYRTLLDSGCDGLNLLGTTGEAMSIAIDDRMRFMRDIAASGLPLDRLMVGTGAASLADCTRLTKAAMALGFAAALVMPPFFYRGVTPDGVLEFFGRLFEAAQPAANSIMLYNFPAMSGITFDPDLVDRLVEAHPNVVAGVKDSSNDPELQEELHARHPDLRIYPGSEKALGEARMRGCSGCISGSVALWPQLAARAWAGRDDQAEGELTRLRNLLAGMPLIAAVRYVQSRRSGDATWQRCLPPLTPLPASHSARCAAAI